MKEGEGINLIIVAAQILTCVIYQQVSYYIPEATQDAVFVRLNKFKGIYYKNNN
jgi:hypothetical protein